MNILEKIIQNKRSELSIKMQTTTIDMLTKSKYYQRNTFSLSKSIHSDNSSGIIAEFKRKSPSKGIINSSVSPLQVAKEYQTAGASAISILTDHDFFGGSNADLMSIRDAINIPILRKEFIIDPFQIHEAKSIGADIILLIAACLTPDEVISFSA